MSKYLIIGGVAGGATTAARLRRNDEKAEIILFEKGDHISYANCGLPYYLGGVIKDRDRLFVQNPQKFNEMLAVDVRIQSEVVEILPKEKKVRVKHSKTGEEYLESYDKLVLSPGAEPVKPPITGIASKKIFTIRNVEDTDRIKSFLDSTKPTKAVVVGAGFIGLEMAENLHEKGIQVTIVEMASQVMTMLDYEMAAEVHQHLKTKGVVFFLKDGVSSFKESEDGVSIKLSSGKKLDTDMVILSIGVRPDSKLAADAGLEIGSTKGIVVNSHLQTSDPDIYALGDAIEFPSPITGQPTITYLAGPANKQGRLLANNLVFGNSQEYRGSIGTAVAKVFDLSVASTGVSEKVLQRAGLEYKCCITHGSSHAGYYPGATAMSIKILFSPSDGRLYGGQIVGYAGVDKRIDLIASVIRRGGTVHELTEIEHAYAPPYSSAKDPVNIIGFVAENILLGRSTHLRWDELRAMDSNKVQLLDVRLPEEVQLGTIEGAINIPLQEIRQRMTELRKDQTVVVFCGVGLRAYMAERILKQNGFEEVYNLSGGLKTYEHAIQKQSNEDLFEGDFIGKDDTIYQTNPEPKEDRKFADARQHISTLEVDAVGLQCPGPIMELSKAIKSVAQGERIREVASDPGFANDVASWCKMTGNQLIELEQNGSQVVAVIEKGKPSSAPAGDNRIETTAKGVSAVVFSDDFDKALASLVIANGAAGAGKEVTLFFTFWGLNLIKKQKKPRVKKGMIEKMFGWMLPSHSKKLKLSKLHMAGMGTSMMRGRMKKLNIQSLEEMLQSALDNGVRMVACTMSMDVMGVKKEELLDGVEMAGVAGFLEASDRSGTSLFI